jgi:serine/threonine-protein kinase PknG
VTAATALERDLRWASGTPKLLGLPVQPRDLRLAAERELRACAHLAATRTDKIRYVDEANRVRPLTLV